jgi:hypothetical protein
MDSWQFGGVWVKTGERQQDNTCISVYSNPSSAKTMGSWQCGGVRDEAGERQQDNTCISPVYYKPSSVKTMDSWQFGGGVWVETDERQQDEGSAWWREPGAWLCGGVGNEAGERQQAEGSALWSLVHGCDG